jgi:hypothetical protein
MRRSPSTEVWSALEQLRLRDRWRRFGRLRAGQSAQRKSRHAGTAAGSRRHRLEPADPHARRHRPAGQQSPAELELPHRAGTRTQSTPVVVATRQDARRLQRDQCDVLRTRRTGRLRQLGAGIRRSTLVVATGIAMVFAQRGQHPRRQHMAWHRRPAGRFRPALSQRVIGSPD